VLSLADPTPAYFVMCEQPIGTLCILATYLPDIHACLFLPIEVDAKALCDHGDELSHFSTLVIVDEARCKISMMLFLGTI
jgi:hypothetical protein